MMKPACLIALLGALFLAHPAHAQVARGVDSCDGPLPYPPGPTGGPASLTVERATGKLCTNAVAGTGGGGGGTGTVTGVNTTCPTSTNAPVSGVVTLTGGLDAVTRSSATDSIAFGDCGTAILYNFGGPVAASLPSAASAGANYDVNLAAAIGTTVTITSGGGTFSSNGLTTLAMAPGASVTLISDGTNWTVGGSTPPPPTHVGYVSSNWYAPVQMGGNLGAAVQGAANLYCHAALIPVGGVTIKAMGVVASTADATNYASVAVYNTVPTGSTGAGHPGSLIDYVAPFTVTNTTSLLNGPMHNTTDTLQPGAYWFCATTESTTAALLSLNNTASNLAGPYQYGVTAAGYASIWATGSVPNNEGYFCALATCATAWGTHTFTWPTSLASGSWWTIITSGKVPLVGYQAN
jgi:hypothetical protein